jgi:hypothetical protein
MAPFLAGPNTLTRNNCCAGANVAFIEVANPLELYRFEAYRAMELDTAAWKTFATHQGEGGAVAFSTVSPKRLRAHW